MTLQSKNKEARLRWQQKCKITFESTRLPFAEQQADKDKRIAKAQNNYAFFVSTYFPHYAKSPCASFHIAAANKIKKNTNLKAVMMWARAHAKSTHFNILIPLWLKIQPKDSYRVMVLIGKSQENATTLIADLQAELEYNQLYIHDFGAQIKYGSWEEGKFTTKDERAYFALGRGQSPRGLRYRQHRPDYIVVDDLDDDQLSRNPDRVNKMYAWLIEALLGTMDMGIGRFVMVGNLISKNSVLQKVTENLSFSTSKVNALDRNGKPAWHEKYSTEQIEEMMRTMGYRSAQKELFNNPITEGAVFSDDWIAYAPPLPLHKYDRLVAYCDPSFKHTRTADYKAVMVLGSHAKHLHILKAFVRKCSVNELVRWFYDFHDQLDELAICRYYMEANFIQDLIMGEFETEGEIRGYQLPISGDNRKKPDKFARIEAISPLFERGLIFINNKEKDNKDMNVFLDQLLAFEKGSSAHDDAPDALEGAVHILSGSIRQRKLPYRIAKRENRRF